MKTVPIISLMLLALAKSFAQEPQSYSQEFKDALRYGAKAKVTIKVVNDTGQPVTNANTRAFFRMTSGPNEGNRVIGVTDEEGRFSAKNRTTDIVFLTIEKDGHYTSRKEYYAQSLDPERLKDGCWLPWDPTIPVVLREIRNPIPLNATRGDFSKGFPCDVDIGFDCEKHDWVAPHGAGTVSDFIVRMTALDLPKQVKQEVENIVRKQKSTTDRNKIAKLAMDLRRIDMAYYRLVISSTDKDAGFIRKRKVSSSKFVSDYEAPTNGYSTTFTTSMEKFPYFEPPNPDDLSGEEYLILKSRVVRDSEGAIISANYGKIYGPLVHGISRSENQGSVCFRPYFNPTPNNRNIEWNGVNIANGEKWGDFQP